ncbi:MAG: hypothetical protein U0736_12255 [Gemmataceae bacterium]
MSDQLPLVGPVHEVQPAVHAVAEGREFPPPSHEQVRLADDVFQRDEAEMAASLIAAQAALALTHNLIRDALNAPVEEEPHRKPRRLDEPHCC